MPIRRQFLECLPIDWALVIAVSDDLGDVLRDLMPGEWDLT